MKTSVIGYPRIGANRELKFASEKYFRQEISEEKLEMQARELRRLHWETQKMHGVDLIPSNDFSFYDTILDTANLLGIVPQRYQALGLNRLETYFSMARGYQGNHGDVKALAMKKWFNTNYHYMVPEIDDETEIRLTDNKVLREFLEAKGLGIMTKPVIPGAFTFLKLARFTGNRTAEEVAEAVAAVYGELVASLEENGVEWVQFDEPALVMDMTAKDISLFQKLYKQILASKKAAKCLLQTYFGDIRDCYTQVMELAFDGIGLDFVEGEKSLELVLKQGFPSGKLLFAGVVNGKNIWRNNYNKTVELVRSLQSVCPEPVIGTSCSLLHVPYTLDSEEMLSGHQKRYLAFAQEKLAELEELKDILSAAHTEGNAAFQENIRLFDKPRECGNDAVREKIKALRDADFVRLPDFDERKKLQKEVFGLPLLPTTTIGSFPQTAEVRANRAGWKSGAVTDEQYHAFIQKKIAECIALQEEIGLDVLVHGEFERNDMVEYFGEKLDGFLFTQKGWVQSYGTRCVKPPIIWADVSFRGAMTVRESVYAQSLTQKPVKGMLTGPVTILNWSFPREDISLRESTLQIALAIREEVLDLERNGIRIIQIDEAALREKLPLRKTDWDSRYLDWAIPAFRLVHSGVKPEIQIHTHMCYSEFNDIIKQIDAMDADVITFEASRSDLTILDALAANGFRTDVGPGVYDIHSPRVPEIAEIVSVLKRILENASPYKVWVNPDCGLKTRAEKEVKASLANMVAAALEMRGKSAHE